MNAGRTHYVTGIDPVADVFDTGKSSDIVNMKLWNHVEFILWWGVGATGTQTITVEACDDVVPTNTSAIPFLSRSIPGGTNVPTALTRRAAAGFTTTAGSSQIIICEVDAEMLDASGYGFVRLTTVEVVNSPVLGGILIRLSEPRQAIAVYDAAIA